MAFSVAELVAWTGGRLVNGAALGDALESIRVSGLAVLDRSRPADIGFFFSKTYQDQLPTAAPGVLVTGEPFVKPLEAAGLPLWKKTAVIACSDPYLAMAIISGKMAPDLSTVAHLPDPGKKTGQTIVHPSAIVSGAAKIGMGVRIGPHCVIEANAEIGSGSVLYPGCFVGPQAKIGEDCVLFPNVTVYENSQVGARVRLHAGVVIGADGFGYAPIRQEAAVVGHQKIYHVGRVVVGDDVEVGANSCIDRATFGETRVGNHAKIDNLVQIAHNVQVDEGAILCGCAAVAGNGSVGKFAYIGGGVGIANQVHVGDGANVGAYTLVTKDVEPGGIVVGNPMREHREFFKIHAMLSRMLAERKKGK